MSRQLTKRLLKHIVDSGLYSTRLRSAIEASFTSGDALWGGSSGLTIAFYATNTVKAPVPNLEPLICKHFSAISHYLTHFPQRVPALRAAAEKIAPTFMFQGHLIGVERFMNTFEQAVTTAMETRERFEQEGNGEVFE